MEVETVDPVMKMAIMDTSTSAEHMMNERLQQLEAALVQRMEEILERRSREQEEAILARLQLTQAETQRRSSETGNEVDETKSKQQRTLEVHEATMVSMKQFADSMVTKVQDIEARLDVLEVRASVVDDKQRTLDEALKNVSKQPIASMEQSQPKANGQILPASGVFATNSSEQLKNIGNRIDSLERDRRDVRALQSSLLALQGAVSKQQDALSKFSTLQQRDAQELRQTIAGHTLILNDAPEAQRRFILVETAAYKHEEALINMTKSMNSVSQQFSNHIQESKSYQEARDKALQVQKQNLDQAISAQVQQETARLQLLLDKRLPQPASRDEELDKTLAEMEKTVSKHQNALVQMRDYLTQHQDFIDGLCKSLGIQFSGAEVDESTQKLPVKFVVDVVHSQQAVQGKLTKVMEDLTKLEKDVASALTGYKSVRTAILEDRNIIGKVVNALEQKQSANGTKK